jgi:uncharacterized membrane protein
MSEQSPARPGRLYLLTALLFGAGTLHFVTPKPFDSIVPGALPGKARTYTYVSGVCEILVGLALAWPRTRRLGGLLAAGLFIAVFPANVKFATDSLNNPKSPLPVKIVAVARLPLQIPMITAALKVRRTA